MQNNQHQLISFDDLSVVEAPIWQEPKIDRTRFVIGYDPFEDERVRQGLSGSKAETHNIFVVYDKMNCRITTSVVTPKPFNEFVAHYLEGEKDKRLFKVSNKFIDGNTGRGQRKEAIREAYQIGGQSSERPDTTLISE